MTSTGSSSLPPLDLGNPEVQRLVRRIFHARGFARRLREAGWEDADAIQEIYVGLLTRQRGRSRFDPGRASLSKYVFLVVSSVTRNLLTRRSTRDRTWQEPDELAGLNVSDPGPDLTLLTFKNPTRSALAEVFRGASEPELAGLPPVQCSLFRSTYG